MFNNARKKARSLAKKKELLLKEFAPIFTDEENVIQDYFCAMNYKQGRMYITPHFLCFLPNIASETAILPFSKIGAINKANNARIIPNSIMVLANEREYFFSSFLHRDETYNLLNYLWTHDVSYIDESDMQEEDDEEESLRGDDAEQKRITTGIFSAEELKQSSKPQNTWEHMPEGQKQQLQEKLKDSTQRTKNILAMTERAKQTGIHALTELTLQAEKLDDIEYDIERVHANLDTGRQILKNMESPFGGGTVKPVHVEKKRVDRTLDPDANRPPIDFEILNKTKSDFLEPVILRFSGDKFMYCDMEKKKPIQIWPISKIHSIVIRARHQHADVRFQDPKATRFRFCAADLQGITNQFYYSFQKYGELQVEFEPGTHHFVYGKEFLLPYKKKSKKQSGFFFHHKPQKTSETVLNGVSKEAKKELDEQDEYLDKISVAVDDLTTIGTTMGNELDRQNEQLGRMNGRVDQANDKLCNTNQRINKLKKQTTEDLTEILWCH